VWANHDDDGGGGGGGGLAAPVVTRANVWMSSGDDIYKDEAGEASAPAAPAANTKAAGGASAGSTSPAKPQANSARLDCWCDPQKGKVCALHQGEQAQVPPAATPSVNMSSNTRGAAAASSTPAQPQPPSGHGSSDLHKGLRRVVCRKGPDGFGFVIKGDAPVLISTIDQGGAADLAGLRTNDVIVEFNGETVATQSQDEVVARFGSAGGSEIDLVVKQMRLEALLEARDMIAKGVDITVPSDDDGNVETLAI